MKLGWNAVTCAAGAAAVLLVFGMISVPGMSFGQSEMLRQIELEDSYLCGKFGMQAESRKFWDCMSDLADLRERHMKMVAYYRLP